MDAEVAGVREGVLLQSVRRGACGVGVESGGEGGKHMKDCTLDA